MVVVAEEEGWVEVAAGSEEADWERVAVGAVVVDWERVAVMVDWERVAVGSEEEVAEDCTQWGRTSYFATPHLCRCHKDNTG